MKIFTNPKQTYPPSSRIEDGKSEKITSFAQQRVSVNRDLLDQVTEEWLKTDTLKPDRAMKSKLEGEPVVVLSNNDGCAVARSQEAKALGVKMGAPWFQMQALARKHGIVIQLHLVCRYE
ncbi:MAG: hypothetical protein Q8K59_12995 [Nitrosomonas sp.]|nr:hypothetical protein [Nitrosomonas sp.]MDP1951975.1 hypothetical protein [Nitrosomonas sp.]